MIYFWAIGPYFGKSWQGSGITHSNSYNAILGQLSLSGLLSRCNRFYIIFLHLIKYSPFLHILLKVQIPIFEIGWLFYLCNECCSLNSLDILHYFCTSYHKCATNSLISQLLSCSNQIVNEMPQSLPFTPVLDHS